jgi:hypothetical protein
LVPVWSPAVSRSSWCSNPLPDKCIVPLLQATLVPAEFQDAESPPDCVACNFGRGRGSMVTAYADGFMAVWDLKNTDEVRQAAMQNCKWGGQVSDLCFFQIQIRLNVARREGVGRFIRWGGWLSASYPSP